MVGGRTILVCGGRDYQDRRRVYDVLNELHREIPIVTVVTGAYKGADKLAEDWAKYREVDYVGCPAKWTAHHSAAGPIRNTHMLDWGPFDVCVAFPGGDGTADMVRKARAAGIPIQEVV